VANSLESRDNDFGSGDSKNKDWQSENLCKYSLRGADQLNTNHYKVAGYVGSEKAEKCEEADCVHKTRDEGKQCSIHNSPGGYWC
jgi:hypothetical protein